MIFGSVCSGIEAASVAWHPLGWRAAWFSEIEPFPFALLAHHYPGTPNLGDMTKIARRVLAGEIEAPDVFTGGTPCQAFSVAGLRKSLDDDRGNLTLKFVELANAIDHVRGRRGLPASIIVWENVPGVLSTKDNAFGCVLAGLAGEDGALRPPGGRWEDAGCVYGPARAVAWRTLDAQYFGLAQRRRRVFVVASAREGFDPAAVLFEWDGVRRDSAPSREAGERAAACIDASLGRLQGCSGQDLNHGHSHLTVYGGNRTSGPIDVAPALNACSTASGRQDFETEAFITQAHAFDARQSDVIQYGDKTGPLDTDGHTIGVLQSVGADCYNGALTGDVAATLGANSGQSANHSGPTVLAFTQNSRSEVREIGGDGQIVGALAAEAGAQQQNYIAFSAKDHGADATADLSPTLRAMPHDGSHANGGGQVAVAMTFDWQAGSGGSDTSFRGKSRSYVTDPPGRTRALTSCKTLAVQTAMQVRRLTPRECERLQGFPDDYTLIPWRGKPASECPDGPRYKALGNSWAVPVVRWIGARIDRAVRVRAAA
jgi:DNA (cytosine-5)-methyltransferase 1